MVELFLKYVDEDGEEQEISVEEEEFIAGRHSDNDLSFLDSRLSREHIKIQRYADVFVVSDLDSSNGTTLNDEDLDEPIGLKNEDILNLGGGLEVEVILINDDPNAQENSGGGGGGSGGGGSDDEDDSASGSSSNSASKSASASASSSGGSGIGKALILAPILGLFLIVTAVGGFFLLGGMPEKEVVKNDTNDSSDSDVFDDTFIRSTDSIDEDDDDSTSSEDTGNTLETPPTTDDIPPTNTDPIPTDTSTLIENTETTETNTNSPPIPDESEDTQKIRNSSFRFMRGIARSNQKPVLLNNQLAILESKVNRFKGSGALASNIKNAQSNAGAIKQLAVSKNLKAEFLTTAALAKLGNSKGNVLSKAQEMAEVLDNLNIQIGDEQADDSLIMMAAYNQGVQNQFLKMRNTLQRLAAKNQNRASEIRTIWFLKEKGELSNAQFDLALSFLAIGTITQNPKAFNVNANALKLN